jgi:hypothetical protein
LLFWTMIKFNSSKNHPKTASELNGKLIVISEEIFIWIYISIAIVISKISIAITIVSGISIAITRVAIAVSIIISIIGVIIGIIAGIAGVICCYITEITLFTKSYCNGLFLVCSALVCSLKCDFYFCISFFQPDIVDTLLPSNLVMTSPAEIPAFSAGDPLTTCDT